MMPFDKNWIELVVVFEKKRHVVIKLEFVLSDLALMRFSDWFGAEILKVYWRQNWDSSIFPAERSRIMNWFLERAGTDDNLVRALRELQRAWVMRNPWGALFTGVWSSEKPLSDAEREIVDRCVRGSKTLNDFLKRVEETMGKDGYYFVIDYYREGYRYLFNFFRHHGEFTKAKIMGVLDKLCEIKKHLT
jgi:hypothetical protein